MEIRFIGTTKLFNRATVVDRLNLEIRDGEMMVLLGPSGCGKTTSLRMLAGLESISGGEIYIGQRLVNNVPPRQRDVAMVFQNYALYPHMTVAQNIGYPLLVRHTKREEIARQVRQVAETLEIDRLLERRPRELSGGERQRVALARAVIRRPVAFLMDEPLSNLDARLRLNMRAELKRLQREMKITTLYVTHDQAEAMTLAHRVAVMRGGTLQQVGTPIELYRRPANLFVAGFLGSPSMNFIRGQIQNSSFHFSGGSISLGGARASGAKSSSVVLGFRPESAVLTAPDAPGAIRGGVFVTEEMGNECFVFLNCEDTLITVRAGADFRAEIGDVLGLRVDPESVHLFDEQTGDVLT
jgi:multiple sugar transport system ATP-binding protein